MEGLGSVKAVWEVRSVVGDLLGEGEFEGRIRETLEDIWEGRVKGVWEGKLGSLVLGLERGVRAGTLQVGTEGESESGLSHIQVHGKLDTDPKSELHPEKFMFSELPIPQPPASAFTASPHLFDNFLKTLTKRVARRTPLLDGVLSELEEQARELKLDMQVGGLPSRLHVEYGKGVEGTLGKVVSVLEGLLGESGNEGVEGEMFVGRVAIYMARQSSFLVDVTGQAEVDVGQLDGML